MTRNETNRSGCNKLTHGTLACTMELFRFGKREERRRKEEATDDEDKEKYQTKQATADKWWQGPTKIMR